MTPTTAPTLETFITPAVSSLSKEDVPTMVDWEMEVEPKRPAFEVTSNTRHGAGTPEPPSFDVEEALLHRRPRYADTDDPMLGLPPPSLAPRFVFNPYTSYEDDTASSPMNDGSLDTAPHTQTPIRTLSSSPPRIYFGPSAITFVPPASYEFLERDPNVKGVPRNYRAWARAGRPKLDVEGAERPDAKSDFRAIGLTYPPDSDSEDGGDEGVEAEKKKKKRKKKQTAKAMVPIDRPRRMVRKLLETAPPATPPLQAKVNDKKVGKREEVKPKPVAVVPTITAMKKGPSSKSTEESESSGRRSSSTLLDTDILETNKRKRVGSDKEVAETPASKKFRVSRRLDAKRRGPQDGNSSSEPPSEDEEKPHLPSRDFSPSPASPAIPAHRSAATLSERRKNSPSASRLPARTTRAASGQSAKPVVAGPSRSAVLPASRPGHRISRGVQSNSTQVVPTRTFPSSLPIIPGYSSFYRRYPLITQFHADDPAGKHINQTDTQPKRALGIWNPPRDYRDLYTPRYTKGSGGKKIALCPICFEEPARGGEGRQEWNHTKTSQHNYHMQYYHGISATRCAPFSPPTAQRIIPVPRPQTNEKSQILQGKCHVCKQWIPLEGCKVGELKVKELLWWKHAAQCHKESKLAGEDDIFVEDDAFLRLKEYESAHPDEV